MYIYVYIYMYIYKLNDGARHLNFCYISIFYKYFTNIPLSNK